MPKRLHAEGHLLDAMIAHPILVNQPIAATPKEVRSSVAVLDLLDRLPLVRFSRRTGN